MIYYNVTKLSNGEYMARKMIVQKDKKFVGEVFQTAEWPKFCERLREGLDNKKVPNSPPKPETNPNTP